MLRTNILGTVGANRIVQTTQLKGKAKGGAMGINPPVQGGRRRSQPGVGRKPAHRGTRGHEAA
eukprot:1154236-Prymnesium_polylepis.1